MSYRVRYHDSFNAGLESVIMYMRSQQAGDDVIARWVNGVLDTIDSLDELPRRHPVDAVQSEVLGTETRKLVLGNHLVFYQVNDTDQCVDVVAFIHGAIRAEG